MSKAPSTYRPNLIVKSVLLAVVLALVSQPLLIAAQPEAERPPDPVEVLTASGDVYLSNLSQAIGVSVQLAATLQSLNGLDLSQLSEASVGQAQDAALALAEHSAVALGAVDDLADSIESLSTGSPAAFDVAGRASAGLPDELRQDLVTQAGLTLGQVDDLQSNFQSTVAARLSVAASGLPAPLVQQLQTAGFSQGEIDQVAQAIANRGLANTSLSTQLAQFRASQDELANARTYALVVYVRLLGKQIGVRQAQGIAPRGVTDAELAELASDELRLLIHVAHLGELWGSEPSLEVGEGDWWFVERYAERMAGRLEGLVVESQNRGLVVELLVAQQMRLLAVSARSGDAAYAKAELDRLAELLAWRVGNRAFVSQQRQQTAGALKVLARMAAAPQVREYASWPVDESARGTAVESARAALTAAGVQDLTALGALEETNEDNNMMSLLFAVGLPFYDQLLVDILQGALNILSALTPENVFAWLRAILTGDTDDPILMVASMLFSLIPVIGVIPDIYSLVTDPSIFVKALSLVGIVGSLGDLLALIPGLQGVAGGSFLGDAAATVMKRLFQRADDVFKLVVNGLKLGEAFEIILDIVKVVIKVIGDVIGRLGDSLDEVIAVLTDFLSGSRRLWDDFVAFSKRAGRGLLLELGFDEGSMFAGGILRRLNSDLAGDVIRSLDNIGDDLAEAGVELSDEAADGLGDAVNTLGEQRTRNIFLTQCLVGGAVQHFIRASKMSNGLARPARLNLCDEAAEIFNGLPPQAQRGFGRIPEADANRILSTANLNHRRIGELLAMVRDGRTLSSEATQGLLNLVGKNLDNAAARILTNYSDEVIETSFRALQSVTTSWSDDAVEGVARLANIPGQDYDRVMTVFRGGPGFGGTGGAATGERLFRRFKLAGDANIAGLDTFAQNMTRSGADVWGSYHTLDYMEHLGFRNVTAVEQELARQVPGVGRVERVYDVVSGGQRFELKNISEMRTRDLDELMRDLQMLTDDELRNLRWVFRGSQDQGIIDSVIRQVKAVNPRVYTEEIFDEDNLIFFRNTRPFDAPDP